MGNNIRELRQAAHISQDQLATMLNVTQGAVYQWEAGLTMPHTSKLPAIAEALNCNIEDIFEVERRTRNAQARKATRRTGRR